MPYETLATVQTPALIIYLLDVSGSMSNLWYGKERIDILEEAMRRLVNEMISRSVKGARILPIYRIAIFVYSDQVIDILGGIKSLNNLVEMGIPELTTLQSTDTANAFIQVERLLQQELPEIQNCPAPLVCHITDGEYSGADPEPVAQRIMSMKNLDGNVLVENMFISDRVLIEPVSSLPNWHGVTNQTSLLSPYAKKLRTMSSPIPLSYLTMMKKAGYQIEDGSIMMFPGESREFIEMGFTMSISMPTIAKI